MAHRVSALIVVFAFGCATKADPIPDPEPGSSPPPTEEPAPAAPTADEPAPAAPSPGTTAPKPSCTVTFEKDVLPALASSCGSASCHAESASPLVDGKQAKETYEQLMAAGFGSIEWSDPHPEVSGDEPPELKKALDAWRMCGARYD